MEYRFAAAEDVNLLVSMRLRFMNLSGTEENYAVIKENCHSYFERALSAGQCDAILAEIRGVCIGTGVIFYYDSVPSTFNPEGKNAYITSMYVEPSHRRQGVAREMLNRLIRKAGERGYGVIMLSASDMGRHLYEKSGFVSLTRNMLLDTRKTGE